MNLKQKHTSVEALPIQKHVFSRKSPDPGTRSEGAMTSDQKLNPYGGQKLRPALAIANTKAKLRKSQKHRINPDKVTQLTLQVKGTEAIKSPGPAQRIHSLDQAKDTTEKVLKKKIDPTKLNF